MKRLLAAVMMISMILLVQINTKAEGIITDSTMINEQHDELFSYDVVFKDFHQAFAPEMFNNIRIPVHGLSS